MKSIEEITEHTLVIKKSEFICTLIPLNDEEKTIDNCHIEFQTEEQGLCGRSLEEALINVNRSHYRLSDMPSEVDLEFKEKSKTDFALNLIYDNPNYAVPTYIKNGLVWLNNQKVLV